MLRIHVVQVTYNLSDPAMEDLLYEAESVRRFAGLKLSEDIPDERTILNLAACWRDTGWGRNCSRRSKAILRSGA